MLLIFLQLLPAVNALSLITGTAADGVKADFLRSFNHHDCSRTASQATPQRRRQHAKANGSKVGFELYSFAKLALRLWI